MIGEQSIDASGMPFWMPIAVYVSARESTKAALNQLEGVVTPSNAPTHEKSPTHKRLYAAQRELERALDDVRRLLGVIK